jgi:hypothetical protein
MEQTIPLVDYRLACQTDKKREEEEARGQSGSLVVWESMWEDGGGEWLVFTTRKWFQMNMLVERYVHPASPVQKRGGPELEND